MQDMIVEIYNCLNKNSISGEEFSSKYKTYNHIYGTYIDLDVMVIDSILVKDSYNILTFQPSPSFMEELEDILRTYSYDWSKYENPLVAISFIYEVDKFLSLSHQNDSKEFIFIEKSIRHEIVRDTLISIFEKYESHDIEITSNSKFLNGKILDSSTETREIYDFRDDMKNEISNVINESSILKIDNALNFYGLNYLLQIVERVDVSIKDIKSTYLFIFIKELTKY